MDALQEDQDRGEELPVLRKARRERTQRRALGNLPAKTLRKPDWPAYLKALEETKNPDAAITAIGKKSYSLISLRKDREARRREYKILGYWPRQAKPFEYLYLLRKHYGNIPKALRLVGSRSDALQEWRTSGRFRRQEQEVFDEFRGMLDEQNLRVALGKNPSTRDSGHLRWLMENTDPEKWGKANKKVVEHNISGKIDISKLDDEILELLGE